VRGLTIPELMSRSEVPISRAAAYRCALAIGVAGRRFNRTRYAAFWDGLNWALPDLLLCRIWRIDRGNLRRRRERLGKGAARYDVIADGANKTFRNAIRREERKSAAYRGPRPC
jgi:hypothetical protein